MAYLVLVRHGLSTYNKQGLWAGWDDPDLAEEGVEEAKKAAKAVADIHFDVAYVSVLLRAKHTLEIIKQELGQSDIPVHISKAINERNYGDFTRKNKWEIKQQLGEEQFQKLRRSWDFPISNGESLKQVYERVIPYYTQEILPQLKMSKNVLVSSSGNALRSLVKYIDGIPDSEISHLEIGTGEVYVYSIDKNGTVTDKDIRNRNAKSV